MDDFRKAVELFKKKKVLVLGDVMLDQYSYGVVRRMSPEAPVPVLYKTDGKFVPGGAANVANNLASLGVKVAVSGVVGNDDSAKKLIGLLKTRGVNCDLIIKDRGRPTTLKHRLVSGTQQIVRLDTESNKDVSRQISNKLLQEIKKKIKKYDTIILSDYAKGYFTKEFTSKIISLAKKNRIPVFADIKPANKSLFKGVDLIAPNVKEAQEMSGFSKIESMGRYLKRYFSSHVIITRGPEGISVFAKYGKHKVIRAKEVRVFDVSGAGDTAISVLALGFVCKLSLAQAAHLANIACSIVIQVPGTSTISIEELESALIKCGNNISEIGVVPKIWGYEKWIENNEKYCSKLLFVKRGYQCSHHYHKVKDEAFLVTSGHVRLELGKKGQKVIHMREGDFQRVVPNTIHSFRGIEDSEILEVSSHHDDEDSYRLDKSKKVNLKAVRV
jgi:rfaE bifunctional protein kinase chain/domain